jgi:hypothetical protein
MMKRLKRFRWLARGRWQVTNGRKVIGEVRQQEGRFLAYDANGDFSGMFMTFEDAAEYLGAINEELMTRKTED